MQNAKNKKIFQNDWGRVESQRFISEKGARRKRVIRMKSLEREREIGDRTGEMKTKKVREIVKKKSQERER